MRTRRQAALAAFAVLIGVGVLSAERGGDNGQSSEARFRTSLAGSAIQGKIPGGHAEFRSDNRNRTRLNVEVEDVNLPVGTVLTVAVHDGQVVKSVGVIKLSSIGGGELELNSDDGDAVPAVKKGDIVTVSDGAKRILAGVF